MFQTVVDQVLVTQRAVGPITLDSIAAAIRTWFDDPRFDPAVPVLWDIRGQIIRISRPDPQEVAQLRQTPEALRAGFRSAILVNDPQGDLAARRLIDSSPWKIEWAVFHTHTEALMWLTESR